MNIPIQPGQSTVHDFVFRAADRMRIDGCANAVAREGLSLALYCPFEALLDHYTGLLLNRLRQQAPEHSIDVYFPANTDSLLGRFNEVLSEQSVQQATRSPQAASQAQIWLVHDAQKLPESELQLLARLIQNFPGANIRAILLMSGHEASKTPLPAFGRKILRWDIEPPTEEQADAALALAEATGQMTAVHQLLQRIQRRAPTPMPTANPAQKATADVASTVSGKASAVPGESVPQIAQRVLAFHQHGARGLSALGQNIGQMARAPIWLKKNAKLSMAIASAMVASTLITLWLQPETFGLKALKAAPPATVKIQALPSTPPALPSTVVTPAVSSSPTASAQTTTPAAATPAGQTSPEPAIEAPDAAIQAQAWARALDPNSFLIQYGTSNTYEKSAEIQRKFPELKESRIVAAYRPKEKLAHFVIVSGPYSPVTQGYEAAKRPGLPPGSWVRSTRNLQDQLKAPASTLDTPR